MPQTVIYVEEIDKDFYESIPEFIGGYVKIMPKSIHFKTDDLLHAERIISNDNRTVADKENLLYFSGGVDATSSLITHLNENPALVTIWGADIRYDNENAWNQAKKLNQDTANRFGLRLITIHSNFRFAYDDDAVNDYSREISMDWWWSAFHHGIAMICLSAPISSGRKNLYFGSTYSVKDKTEEWGGYVTASDPAVDNYVRFNSCRVIHDGYEFSRYDKIVRICNFFKERKEKYFLRVCYLANTGKNCGHCEKCASAAMGIRLAGGKPSDFGIDIADEDLPRLFMAGIQEMGREEKYAFMSFYSDFQKEYRRQKDIKEVPPVLRLFYKADLADLADSLLVPCNEVIELSNTLAMRHDAEINAIAQRIRCENEERITALENDKIRLENRVRSMETPFLGKIKAILRKIVRTLNNMFSA